MPNRRTLLMTATWSVPIVAASIAMPVAAATVNTPIDVLVSMTLRPSAPAATGQRAEFFLAPTSTAAPLPAGTILRIETTQIHSRSWTVVSSNFTYVRTEDADGNPPSDSVNGRFTASTYLTARAFTQAENIGLYFIPYPSQVWGLRITATLPTGWSPGPGSVLVATAGPLYS